MPTTDPVTAVVIRIVLPRPLERIRRRHDPAATAGVPAHVTVLFPFVPVAQLAPTVRRDLAEIARTVDPFVVRFARVGRFPGVVYLEPEPAGPFARLTAAIAARFPAYPPYGGQHAEVVPHLTLSDAPGAPLGTIEAAARPWLPFSRRVSALELLTEEDSADRWHRHWRMELGPSLPTRSQRG